MEISQDRLGIYILRQLITRPQLPSDVWLLVPTIGPE